MKAHTPYKHQEFCFFSITIGVEDYAYNMLYYIQKRIFHIPHRKKTRCYAHLIQHSRPIVCLFIIKFMFLSTNKKKKKKEKKVMPICVKKCTVCVIQWDTLFI